MDGMVIYFLIVYIYVVVELNDMWVLNDLCGVKNYKKY